MARLTGTDLADTLQGTDQSDTLDGKDGRDSLYGKGGNDFLNGGKGSDYLNGGDGDDILLGGGGGETYAGGAGSDRFVFAPDIINTGGDIIKDFELGIDKIDVSALGYTGFSSTGSSPDQLRMIYSATTNRTSFYNEHDNTAIFLLGDYRAITSGDFIFAPTVKSGDAGSNNLFGAGGSDVLKGGDGLDILKGAGGDDVLIGGARHDSLYGNAGRDVFLYTAATDSTHGDVDVIWDFQHGVDTIDIAALGYTGFTAGTAGLDQLRLTYSTATNRTYLVDDHSDFEIALTGDYRSVLTANDFHFSPTAPRIGFYEAMQGTGGDKTVYKNPINALGYTPVSLNDLSGADITGLDAVFVMNADNFAYNPELLSRSTALADYVFHGGVLIIHDRYVAEAEIILPGLTRANIVRDLSDPSDVNFVNLGGAIAHGPGGDLTDTSLDSADYSSHGFAFDGTLSGDVVRVQTTGNPGHVVSLAYSYGAGAVYYSTIPADFYLSFLGDDPMNQAVAAYTQNVIAWAVADHHNLLDL